MKVSPVVRDWLQAIAERLDACWKGADEASLLAIVGARDSQDSSKVCGRFLSGFLSLCLMNHFYFFRPGLRFQPESSAAGMLVTGRDSASTSSTSADTAPSASATQPGSSQEPVATSTVKAVEDKKAPADAKATASLKSTGLTNRWTAGAEPQKEKEQDSITPTNPWAGQLKKSTRTASGPSTIPSAGEASAAKPVSETKKDISAPAAVATVDSSSKPAVQQPIDRAAGDVTTSKAADTVEPEAAPVPAAMPEKAKSPAAVPQVEKKPSSELINGTKNTRLTVPNSDSKQNSTGSTPKVWTCCRGKKKRGNLSSQVCSACLLKIMSSRTSSHLFLCHIAGWQS